MEAPPSLVGSSAETCADADSVTASTIKTMGKSLTLLIVNPRRCLIFRVGPRIPPLRQRDRIRRLGEFSVESLTQPSLVINVFDTYDSAFRITLG